MTDPTESIMKSTLLAIDNIFPQLAPPKPVPCELEGEHDKKIKALEQHKEIEAAK